jgi:hypothetical protein
MARSITPGSTVTPASRAARRAITWQMVTEMSASRGTGWYRHPPRLPGWVLCDRSIREIDRSSLSLTTSSGVMP